MESVTINIINIIGDQYGVEAQDGQKVYQYIRKAIDNQHKIVLSFLNIQILTTAFLNTAIGQLYKDYTEEQIKKHLQVVDISDSGKVALKRVVDTAKIYYKDPEALKRSVDQIMEE